MTENDASCYIFLKWWLTEQVYSQMRDVHSTYKVHYGSYVFPSGSKKVKVKLSFMPNS